MREIMNPLIFLAGFAQLGVLVASALVPLRLKWKEEFAGLPRLLRQLFWVYGGYIVLAIVALGLVCIVNADELAGGGLLARSVCGYIALFWGVRLCLQPIFDVEPFLTKWWLKAGYHLLTLLFASFTVLFTAAAVLP